MQIRKFDRLGSLYSILTSSLALASIPLYGSIYRLIESFCKVNYPLSAANSQVDDCTFAWRNSLLFDLPLMLAITGIGVGTIIVIRHHQVPRRYVILAALACIFGILLVAFYFFVTTTYWD